MSAPTPLPNNSSSSESSLEEPSSVRRRRFDNVMPAANTVRLWAWAAVAGIGAAAAVIGFGWLMKQVEFIATGHRGGLVDAALSLSPWTRVAVCTCGGVLAGLALYLGNKWAARGPRGTKNLDYIDAAREGRVDLNDRTTLARTVSSLLSVGTGASIGREGPMVQMAAWLSSWLARLVAKAPEERNTLMVCGIAAGIASAYHAPVAGVVFVLELALGFFSRKTVAPVLIASASASSLIYWIDEPKPLYAMPDVAMVPTSLGIALLAGIVFGAIGWGFLAMLERAQKLFSRIELPMLRLGLGGLLVGLMSMAVPQVWGNGYSVVSHILEISPVWQWLALVFVAKVVATTLSSGSGAVGGVFTPSLFVGAAAGSLLAQLLLQWMPLGWIGDPRMFAVIGMAAVLAAVTHAPLMSIVMVLEMTNQFQLTVPVMLACGVAHAISTQFGVKPLYGNPIESPAGRP